VDYVEDGEDAGDGSPDASSQTPRKGEKYALPDDASATFPDWEGDTPPEFVFFPDGSASGPDVLIKVGNIESGMGVSKLTGIAKLLSAEDLDRVHRETTNVLNMK